MSERELLVLAAALVYSGKAAHERNPEAMRECANTAFGLMLAVDHLLYAGYVAPSTPASTATPLI